MRKKLFNQIGQVRRAPNRFSLDVFGGDLTIHAFRENATRDETTAKPINTKPFVDMVIPFVSNTKKMNEINNSTTNNNALKLKRSKPLRRNHNNLESMLGLVIT
jgi:hypothetical protein